MPKTSEFALHQIIKTALGQKTKSSIVELGLGDDAAVLRPLSGRLAMSSDACVEGVHFDLRWYSPADIAHKALGGALSDLAAMRAEPRAATVSIGLPVSLFDSGADAFLAGFYAGARDLCVRWDFDIAGGDLVRSLGGIFVDVAVLGETSQPLLRSGAKPGDILALSGCVGSAAAGLEALRRGEQGESVLIAKQMRPEPRFDKLLQMTGTTAGIDVSDGLASDALRLALSSGIGLEIKCEQIPLAPEALRFANNIGADATEWALRGGEDYELLVTFDPREWHANVERDPTWTMAWHSIGICLPEVAGHWLIDRSGLRRPLAEAHGYDHAATAP